jgi:Flp pilus assembly protein TadG
MNLDPSTTPPPRRRFESLRRFWSGSASAHAMAATEFALILPLALVVFTGSLVYGTASEINRKVTLTARNVTDLVSQYSSLTSADMTTLINSAAQVMAPFSTANVTLVITDLTVSNSGQATVEWSVALSGSGLTTGATVLNVPANILAIPGVAGQATMHIIWGHVAYQYTPSIGYQFTGPITLYDDIYLSPRLSADVQYPAATTAP